MTIAAARPRRIGQQTPTKRVAKRLTTHHLAYRQFKLFLPKIGINLFPWQEQVLKDWLTRDRLDGGYAYGNAGLSVPRQNGKTEIIIARTLIGIIYFKEKVVYTSYRDDSAKAIFERICTMITGPTPAATYLRAFFDLPRVKDGTYVGPGILTANGQRKIISTSGGSCSFITRGGGVGRGFTVDVAIFDEAQALAKDEVARIVPTGLTRKTQYIYCGTPIPVTEEVFHFGDLRTDMISGILPNSTWSEWGVSKLERKENKDAWYQSNPSLGLLREDGFGMTEKSIQNMFTLPEEEFATEILGYWSSKTSASLMDINTWDSLEDDEPYSTSTEKLALGVKFSVDGERYSVVIASRDSARETYLQVLSDGLTYGPVEDFTEDNQGRVYANWLDYMEQVVIPIVKTSKCVGLLVDGKPHVAELQVLLAKYGLWDASKRTLRQRKVQFAGPDIAAAATGLFVETVRKEELRHSGDSELGRAVKDAGKRNFRGDSGAYGVLSLSGQVPMTPLEAATLAFYQVTTTKVERAPIAGVKQGYSSLAEALGGHRRTLTRKNF